MHEPWRALPIQRVPAGRFWMGIDEPRSDRSPRHSVKLDAFDIGVHEVTNAQFADFITARGYAHSEWWSDDGWRWRTREGVTEPQFWTNGAFNGPTQPVVGVSWYEAEAFCKFSGVRLPTEAEWEKAARGADERIYPWGNDWDAARANGGMPGAAGTVAVESYPSGVSPYGVFDMAGNAWEWVGDWYDAGYYGTSPLSNPIGPSTGREKVLRGGSWKSSEPKLVRTVSRDFMTIDVPKVLRLNLIGFRCARTSP
jgi:formylglycine-generating enzyme required for sulfatase activity